jgi:hypothetical protein
MTESAPIDVARALFDALSRADWDAAAQLADPDSLAKWQQTQIALLADEAEALAEPPPKGDSGSIRQIQTDPATTSARLGNYGATLFPNLFGSTSLAELAGSSAAWFFSRYLEATAPIRAASTSSASPHVIGELLETDAAAYVLYRWKGLGWPTQPQEVAVLRMRRGLDGWRYLVDELYGPPLLHLARRPARK